LNGERLQTPASPQKYSTPARNAVTRNDIIRMKLVNTWSRMGSSMFGNSLEKSRLNVRKHSHRRVSQRDIFVLGLITAWTTSLMQMHLKTLMRRRRHMRRRTQMRCRSQAQKSSMRLCLPRRNPFIDLQMLPSWMQSLA
jgi:hypothetical protein